jgi:cytidine deaminase
MTVTLPSISLPGCEYHTPHGTLRVADWHLPSKTVEVDTALVKELVTAARLACETAYAPFSRFHVGAALVMADDAATSIITGTNVENSSYGLTICAERAAIFSGVSRGFRRLKYLAVSCRGEAEFDLRGRSPCGACRQVICEFADDRTLILLDRNETGLNADIFDIDRLLPWGFAL